jgi:uncharacterized membrane protein
MRKKSLPHTPHIAEAIERNINALLEIRRQMDARKTRQDRVADAITGFSGNLLFVYFHIVWFVIWMLWNTGLLGLAPFDTFPFGLLTMIVSLEAIFLSTFVLVSQNRLTEISDKRSELDLQINLLTEYEVTKILCLTDAIADHLGLTVGRDPELEQLKEEISPERILQEMEKEHQRKKKR